MVLQTRHLVGGESKNIWDVAGLAITDLDTEGSNENEPGEALCALHRHFRRDPASQGTANQSYVAEILLGQEVKIEVGQIVDSIDGSGVRRMAEPGVGRRKHAPVSAQQVEKRGSRIKAIFAVQHHDWSLLPQFNDFELHPMDG